jgi:LacI family repressor for deo operon, udp, cdd, tsx, nupC, and nupG
MIAKKFQVIKINKKSALPMVNQLANQLTWLIADGVIKKDEKLPPIREFAEVLQIHHHTVRAAYHLLEKKNLVSIHPKIGTVTQDYIPFITKNNLDNSSNDFIGILVPSITDFYQQIIYGIESIARESKLIPVILNCNEDPIYAEAIYKNLSARNTKGFINISVGFSDEFLSNFDKNENLDVPLVFLDVSDAETHSFTINTSEAIYVATNHMLNHGYKDLALVNCPSDWPVGRETLKGFSNALISHGVDFNQTSIFTVPDFGFEGGYFVIERMLTERSIPRAIVAISDSLALGALSALKNNGLRVPNDVALIGFNDILLSSIIDPSLTTISLPMFEMGKQAMFALQKILKGDIKHWIHKNFSGRLIARESCGCKVKYKGGI